MNTDDKVNQHTSQIARLEQVMTALAEAQIKTEEDAKELRQALILLAGETRGLAAETRDLKRAMTALADAQAQTERQFQAYLNTRPQ
ncbi:hypothetical protein SBA3_2840004 [Candidatus Sulfopaludibacter sp. SbA3]|nr:hypothetical protein SBA3_2840004 [Candidatus Sulfopaludibacter sp. SbA3]